MKKINIFIDGSYYSKLWNFMMTEHLPFQYIMNWKKFDYYLCKFISNEEGTSIDDYIINQTTICLTQELECEFNEQFLDILKNNEISISYGSKDLTEKREIRQLLTWETCESYYKDSFDYAVFILDSNNYIPVIDGLRREGVKSIIFFLSDISNPQTQIFKFADYAIDFEYLFNEKIDMDANKVFIRRVINNNSKESDKRFYKFVKNNDKNQVNFYIHRSIGLKLDINQGKVIANDIEVRSEINNPIKLYSYSYDGIKYYICIKTIDDFINIMKSGIPLKNNIETMVIDTTNTNQNLVAYYFDAVTDYSWITFPKTELLFSYNQDCSHVSKKEQYKLLIEEESKKTFIQADTKEETLAIIKRAAEEHLLIDGYIENIMNGGYSVDVGHNIKGFLPLGKADPGMITDTTVLIGVTSKFYIEELDLENFNLVLNRKKYIKEYVAASNIV